MASFPNSSLSPAMEWSMYGLVRRFFLFLALVASAHALPVDPGGAAMDFLEKVRQRNLDLEPGGDTAISPQTASEKKAAIARRLERMAKELGTDRLEIGAIKTDENYAGVLVRKTGGFDPSRLQVFALALVKRDAGWSVAPVPASFENAGAGYAILLKKRLKALEDWMLREQVLHLEKLREQSRMLMRQKIETRITPTALRAMSPRQVTEKFIMACENGDLPTALGLMGGLAEQLPEDWSVRLKAAERSIEAGPDALRPWRLLTAPEVLRVIVLEETEPKEALISIGCLDPSGTMPGSTSPKIEFIHLQLTRGSDQLWQIHPPPAFLLGTEIPSEDPDDILDNDLLDAFPARFLEAHPATPVPSVELAQQTLSNALRETHFRSLLALADFNTTPEAQRKACIEAARLWRSLHDPTIVRYAMPIAFQSGETDAAVIFQIVSTREPGKFTPMVFHFEKTHHGWCWVPLPSPVNEATTQNWLEVETARWKGNWQKELFESCGLIASIAKAPQPSVQQASDSVTRWLSTTGKGGFQDAIALMACFDNPRSRAVSLQNLGYEILSARRSSGETEITGVYQGNYWTAVGVSCKVDGEIRHPLYLVVPTAQGPRLLIQADLFASDNRSREFLNKAVFTRLSQDTPAEAILELKELLAKHQAASTGKKPAENSVR
jgi:hypothetical protein